MFTVGATSPAHVQQEGGGSWLTQAFLTHALIQEGDHGQIGLYSLYWPAVSSPLAVGFSFTIVCEIFAHYVASVHYSIYKRL